MIVSGEWFGYVLHRKLSLRHGQPFYGVVTFKRNLPKRFRPGYFPIGSGCVVRRRYYR